MKKKRMRPTLLIVLLISTLIAGGAVWIYQANGKRTEKDGYAEAVTAAKNLERCMAEIRTEKLRRGIALSKEDRFSTGMMGEEFNFITTTNGEVQAKRTTCDPNMAAMLVFMLKRAGLKSGDTVGASFSGSFPTLNLAVITACEALSLKLVYTASCGASTYGANNPELCFPEMCDVLLKAGLIHTTPALLTPGGGSDTGGGTERELFDEIWQRTVALGYPTLVEENHQKNMAAKTALFDREKISCFISVGGNITALGYNMIVDRISQGIIETEVKTLNEKSGLIEYYRNRKTKVIHLLNIKKLVVDEGLHFDPDVQEIIGESDFYFELKRPLWVLAVGLLLIAALLAGESMLKGNSRFHSEWRQ